MGILSRAPELLVGLDIGSHSVKLCQFKMTDRGPRLVRFDCARLPEETIVEKQIKNKQALSETIRGLARANKCVRAKCALSVSGPCVIIKKISIPEMASDELHESLQWEAEQYIPFDIKDVYVDAQILNPKAGRGMMDVVILAAKKDAVDCVVACVREAGMIPVSVEPDVYACQNAFNLNYGLQQNEAVALLNVGVSVINIGVVINGISTYVRDILMGGSLINEQIMKEFRMSREDAGYLPKTQGPGACGEAAKTETDTIGLMVYEIRRSLDFFAATTISPDISRVYLSGGMSASLALVRELERQLEIPVEVVNAFKGVIVDSRQFDLDLLQRHNGSAAVAVGLARRYVGDETVGRGDVRTNFIMGPMKRKLIRSLLAPRRWTFRIPFTSLQCNVDLYSIR